MKNEKIGKVTLDYTYYPGEDKYSDGSIEDEMLEIAKKYREEEYGKVIAEKKSWPILYHFSHIRENIIDWLPMTGKEKVLEIGAGPGAITGALTRKAASVTCIDLSRRRCMINAYRHRECDNLRILVGNFQDIEANLTETFDLITLIGVFEYAQFSIQSENPFVDYLARIRSHLAPGGRIVIAIENRIGLKYWAGATEDHTGVYFEGLEGYPTTDYVRTFSKPELEAVMREAGLEQFAFYYPYPDYKLPERIYSEQYLPRKGELNRNRQNLDRERIQVFSEERVYDSLLESGLFQQFSNSFLVVAGTPGKTQDFVKYSNERGIQMRIRTEILEDAKAAAESSVGEAKADVESGRKIVRKIAASPQAWKHVQKIYERSLALEKDLKHTLLKVNKCSVCKDGVQFPFLEGWTLEERLDELWKKKKTDALLQEMERYFGMFAGDAEKNCKFEITAEFEAVFGRVQFERPQTCRRISDIDMIFSNAIESGDGYELIDYEWTFDFPIPVKYLVYRCLYYYILGNSKRDELIGENLYERFGISESEREQFASMEKHFQQHILGDYMPIWKQYDDISEGVMELSTMLEEAQKEKNLRRVEVYFDDGRGFGTWSWKKFQAALGVNSLEITLPKGTKAVRLDPCACQSVVRVQSITQKGKKLNYHSNGMTTPGGDLIFDTEDPQIIFEVPSDASVKVTFRAEAISGLGREALLNQQGRINWMEQTKAWKLYERMKGMRKKQA